MWSRSCWTREDPNTQYMGMTPLALAASNAALPIVEALIAHGADVNAPFEIRGADGRNTTGLSPLALAAMTASGRSSSPCHGGETVLEQERFYRKWNLKKEYRKSEEQEQEEAASCHESALRTMEALAAAGAELLPSDPAQLTPLFDHAMRFTMPGYMNPLKEMGYFVEDVQNTATASRDVVDLLVRLTASPTPRPAGRTPMIFESAENGDDHLAQTLMAAGAPPPPRRQCNIAEAFSASEETV